MAGFEDKVKKAKQQIADAKKSFTAASNAKVLSEITDKAKAQAKVKRDYANTLQGTLDNINSQLDLYATKIARGDKLTTVEQKELDRLLKQSQDVSSTIDKALKDAVNIEAQGQRDYAAEGARQRGVTTSTITAPSSGAPTGSTATPRAIQTTPSKGSSGPSGPSGPKKTVQSTPQKISVPQTSGVDTSSLAGIQTASATPAAVPGNVPSSSNIPPKTPTPLETLLKKTEFWYDLPDYIFQTVPALGDLLVKAVAEGWSNDKFLAAAKLTPWWQSNSATIRQRIIDKASYDELKAAGQDVSKSNYGQYLSKQMNAIKAKAKQIAGVALTDEQAQQVAEKIYNGNLDDDPVAITKLIIPFIGKVTDRYAGSDVTTYGGQALQDYQLLQGIAKANGLSLKDILPQISAVTAGGDLEKAVLQAIAAGDIDVRRVAQNARMIAAKGQPEYVRNLLNQGYDLEQIYSPYKNVMGNLLDINPDQIDLNDKLLRKAFNEKGALKLNDFRNLIKQDARYLGTPGATGDAQIRLAIKDAIVASGATVNDADFNDIVNQAISKGLDPNSPEIRALIRSKISYTAGAKLAGAAGNILEQLRSTGAANGIDVDKTFGSNLQDWIQKVDQGESIETYKRLIRSAASMGLPDNVKKMLDQGVDLESIYGPYRGLMSSILEINPDTITLNDPVLRSAIGPSGETTLYDFQRLLRKDPRWQYTNNARQETSNAVLNVLRNFGFQG